MMIGCGIFFVGLDCSHVLPPVLLRSGAPLLSLGLGLPHPSVTLRLAFSSLSQNKEISSSSSVWWWILGISCLMLKLDLIILGKGLCTKHNNLDKKGNK